MNVLIVDDDRFVVTALVQKLDWAALGIKQIYTAYNIRQAMKVFGENTVDILISDIEMPQGSGLELLAWLRSEGFNVQAIFLTNFADFNYAQKAIELQSFEYYLKPIEFDKLELIIKKAIKKAKLSRSNEDALKVGHYWQQNKEELKDHFWQTYLKNNDFNETDSKFQEQIKLKNLDDAKNFCYLPILLKFFPYQLVENEEIISVFDEGINLHHQLKTVIVETFSVHSIHLEGFLELSRNKEEYLAIFKVPDDHSKPLTEILSPCNELISTLKNEMNCEAQCMIGSISSIQKTKSAVKVLQVASKENVDFRNKAFLVGDYRNEEGKYIEPNLQLLEHYLESGNRISFYNKCYQYLTNLLEKNALNNNVLCSFRLDITQLVYTHLKKNEILAHKLFQGKINDFLFGQSSRSIDDLMIYISYLVEVSLNYMDFTNSRKSVINTILDYIDQNYQDNITRDHLARIVYLSPDYIARFFKKETGIPLVNYIIKKRVDIAKELLVNTNLPVHIISDKVGYGNYSYFTKLFKKETNYTPVDYRKINFGKNATQ
ncbi:response regulator transcription factor [Mesobacillus foraminis]|uniref:response regulator transcription factor n=1 Tax=Mesobacillus foraminis TaxID=279826 RepID=UPI0013CE7289|nr:response regulator [Mesobacillus foraminis]